MQNWDIYKLGLKLGAVRDFLRNSVLDEQRKHFQQLERALAAVAISDPGKVKSGENADWYQSDEYFLARILLGILQRGTSPLVSPWVEEALLEAGPTAYSSQKHDSGEVGFRLEVSPDRTEEYGEALVHAQFVSDPRTIPDWLPLYDSESERRFVATQLAPLLGSALALVEPQRTLSSMLNPDPKKSEQFVNQRVDFALETPTGLKIVIEIDGPEHCKPEQQMLDKQRDRHLKANGWDVERFPVGRDHLPPVISERLRQTIECDSWLQSLRHRQQPAIQLDDIDLEANRLTQAAHGIARIQLGVLIALLDGTLLFDAGEWRIGVIERDRVYAALAIADLLDQIDRLGAIYGIQARPRVRLDVLPASETVDEDVLPRSVADHLFITEVDWEGLEEVAPELDVLLDVSVRARPADRFPGDDRLADSMHQARRALTLRTANYSTGERFWHWPVPRAANADHVSEHDLRYFLQLIFRKQDFRPQQVEVIRRALERKDLIGVLPTGSGKSVTFQLPTMLSPGVALVIAPLRSLIDDQVDNLHRAGINRLAAIHGGMAAIAKSKSLREITSGTPRFIYVAPERLQMTDFRAELAGSPLSQSVSFVVVDEAHCVSEWGHDFRPSYLNVGRVARILCTSEQEELPILALTGTASNSVLIDIARELEFDHLDVDGLIAADSFDRDELRFIPIRTSTSDKQNGLDNAMHLVAEKLGSPSTQALVDDKGAGGIVFCRYVNGAFGVGGVSTVLMQKLSKRDDTIRLFAGSTPKQVGLTPAMWAAQKAKTQRAFKENLFPLLVATSSFGMGIDKPNIRYTIHYGIPNSLEALAQEAGRAGRDRKVAACAVIYTGRDNYDFLSPDMSTEHAREYVKHIPRKDQDDVTRLLFLHFTSYPGVAQDSDATRSVLQAIFEEWNHQQIKSGRQSTILLERSRRDDQARSQEQALYRLSILGIVSDYTIDFKRGLFEVVSRIITPEEAEDRLSQYVRRYNVEGKAQAVVDAARASKTDDTSSPYDHVIRALSTFIYEVIEPSRRRALLNLVEELRKCDGDGEKLREGLSQFLSNNVFSSSLTQIVNASEHVPSAWWSVLEGVTSPELARRLLAGCRRQLESNPTHPGLLILEGLSAMHGAELQPDSIATSIQTGLENYASSITVDSLGSNELAAQIVDRMRSIHHQAFESVIRSMASRPDGVPFARLAYPHVTDQQLKRICAMSWIQSITDHARDLRINEFEGMKW